MGSVPDSEQRRLAPVLLGLSRKALGWPKRWTIGKAKNAASRVSTDLGDLDEYGRSLRDRLRPNSWRNVAAAFGCFFILVGVVSFVYPLYLLSSFSWAKLYHHERAFLNGGDEPTFWVLVAIALVAPILGRALIASQRRVALFLRRFGHTEPTNALGFAIETGIGRSWRVVTLDDRKVEPLGVRKGLVRATRIINFAEVAVVVGVIWLVPKQQRAGEATAGSKSPLDDVYRAVGRFFGANVGSRPISMTTIVLGGALLLLSIWIVSRIVFAVNRVLIRWLVQAVTWIVPFLTPAANLARAEKASRVEIKHKRQIWWASRRVVRRSRRAFSPQLIVVTVVPALWTHVVRRFASVSSVVITDVSELSENLLWEIETLKPLTDKGWVFVADAGLFDRQSGDEDASPASVAFRSRLDHVLKDERVLFYRDTPDAMSQFVADLRGALAS